MKEKELLSLKKEIEEAKIKVSELKGRKQTSMHNLKENFGCDSLDAAKKLIKTLGNKIKDLESRKEKQIEDLQKKYNL